VRGSLEGGIFRKTKTKGKPAIFLHLLQQLGNSALPRL
jgi:hypothetical protein